MCWNIRITPAVMALALLLVLPAQPSRAAARSTRVLLANKSPFTLTLTGSNLDHGDWTPGGWLPPATIAPGANVGWQSESSGVATGTEGWVRYSTNAGQNLYIAWDNPYLGTNKYQEFVDDGLELFHTGGSGNNTVVGFTFAVSVPHRVGNFLPSVNGFHFTNHFPSTTDRTVYVNGIKIGLGNASNGLCGGMTFAVRDCFEAGVGVNPLALSAPPCCEGDMVFDYLVDRLFTSFDIPDGPILYLKLMDPLYPDTDANLLNSVGLANGRAWVMAREEWPQIKSDIDSGHLSAMTLILVKSLLPTDMGENHQVLAYGYELSGGTVTLHIYDPNEPGRDDLTLAFNRGFTDRRIDVQVSPPNWKLGGPVYCFVRMNYSWSNPPLGGSVIGATSDRPGATALFVRGYDSQIWSKYFPDASKPGNWSPWFPLGPNTFPQGSEVTASSDRPGATSLFTLGSDGQVWSSYFPDANKPGNWSAWFPLGPNTFPKGSAVTVSSDRPGATSLFVRGFDGQVWSKYFPDANKPGNWSAWFPLGPNTFPKGAAVTVSSDRPGATSLFMLGFDGQVWSSYFPAAGRPGNWSPWFPLGPNTFPQGAVVTAHSDRPGATSLFAVGSDGQVWSKYFPDASKSGNWSPWFPLGPNTFPKGAAVTASSDRPGATSLFTLGSDGQVWSSYFPAAGRPGNWSPWFPLGPNTFSQGAVVTAHSDRPGATALFAVGPDGQVWSKYFPDASKPGNWSAWFPLGTTSR